MKKGSFKGYHDLFQIFLKNEVLEVFFEAVVINTSKSTIKEDSLRTKEMVKENALL